MTWLMYALLSGFSAALMSIVAKMIQVPFDPIFATAFRAIIMLLLFLVLGLVLNKFSGSEWHTHSTADWLYLCGSGLIMALGLFFYFRALDDGYASHVVAVDRLAIVYVLLFSAMLFGEKITWMKALGALFMVLGAACISLF